MGIAIRKNNFDMLNPKAAVRPIVYCLPSNSLQDEAYSLNLPLARLLSGIKPERRTMRLESCVNQVLAEVPDNGLIKDFDVLFNPAYSVDVLKIFTNAYRKKKFDLVWPGRYMNGKLIYAEEGYPDYHTFEIENYDITVVFEEK